MHNYIYCKKSVVDTEYPQNGMSKLRLTDLHDSLQKYNYICIPEPPQLYNVGGEVIEFQCF